MKTRILSLALGTLLSVACWDMSAQSTWDNPNYIIDEGFVYFNNDYRGDYELIKYIGDESDVIIPDSVYCLSSIVFNGCDKVRTITIPTSVRLSEGGSKAFWGCSNLEAIHVNEGNSILSSQDGVLFDVSKTELFLYPGQKKDEAYTIPGSVTENFLGAAFIQRNAHLKKLVFPKNMPCIEEEIELLPNLEVIEVGENNPTYSSIDGVLYSKDGSKLIFCPQGRTKPLVIPKSVNDIDIPTLLNCDRLTGISVEEGGHLTIKDDILYTADETQLLFCARGKRGNVSLSENVRSIKPKAFANCTLIANVVLPAGVETIADEAFLNCSGIRDVSLPVATNIGIRAFSGCTNLRVANVPNAATIGREAFKGCTALTIANLPGVTTLGESCFEGCSALSGVLLPTNSESIGESAFKDCAKLASVIIPQGISTIKERTFENCSNLSSVVFPPDIDSIMAFAFKKTALEWVHIPGSVTDIQQQAFGYCQNLTEVIVEWPTPPSDISFAAFLGIPNKKRSTLVVPKGSRSWYDTRFPWKNFNVIEEYTLPSHLSQERLNEDDISIISASGTDRITISLREGIGLLSVQLFDMAGKQVYKGTSSEINKTSIGIVQGHYILNVETSHGHYRKKIML